MADIDPVKIGVMWSKVESMEKEIAEMPHNSLMSK